LGGTRATLLDWRVGDGMRGDGDEVDGSEVLRRLIRLAMCLFDLTNTGVIRNPVVYFRA
jgi:hypothetical protein